MTETALQVKICTNTCTNSSEIVNLNKKEIAMEQLLTLKIFKILCENRGYVTSEKIADQLNISSRTVKSYMNQVEQFCNEKQCTFQSVRGKGYCINESIEKKLSIASTIIYEEIKEPSKDEKLYFLLYLLLVKQESLYISDLEIYFHLSRSSIKPIIDAAKEWLNVYHIECTSSRKEGYKIHYGEKRLRLAITHLIVESMNIADSQSPLNLTQIIEYYTERISFDNVKQFINQIVKQYDLFISKYDRNFLRIFILVAIVRIYEHHFVTMTENKLKLINTAEMKPYLNYMDYLSRDIFQLLLPQDEQIYLFVLVLSAAATNHEHEKKIIVPILNMPEPCLKEVESCLKKYFNLDEASINDLKNDYNSLITREAIYNVRDNNPTKDDYYALSHLNFHVIKDAANEILDISMRYYNITYTNRFIHNLTYIINYYIEKNKMDLRTLVVHDCNSFEYKTLFSILLKKIPCISIIKIIPYQAEGIEDINDYDLILTTVMLSSVQENQLKISKLPREKELAFINDRVLELYEKENFKRIIKDYMKYDGKPFDFK